MEEFLVSGRKAHGRPNFVRASKEARLLNILLYFLDIYKLLFVCCNSVSMN